MKIFLKASIAICFLAYASSSTAQEVESQREEAVEKKAKNDNPILNSYPWLKDLLKSEESKNQKVEIYNLDEVHFVIVDQDGKRVMYDNSGQVYCTNSSTLKCEEFYKLGAANDSWIVGQDK